MQTIRRFRCRVEKKVTDHLLSDEGGTLPSHLYLSVCRSCGVMGMERVEIEGETLDV